MRELTEATLGRINDRIAIEPIVVLKLELNGIYYFGDEIKTIQTIVWNGKILEVGDIRSEKTADGEGTVQSVSIKLEDSDFMLKGLLTSTQFAGKDATLYHLFEDIQDMLQIFKGKINSPIVWSDSDRTLSFDIVAKIDSQEVGCILSEDAVAPTGQVIPDGAKNTKIPIVFGTVEDVPTIKILEPIKGTLKSTLFIKSPFASNDIEIENGEAFPQGIQITIYINGIPIIGSMLGTKFTIIRVAPDEGTVNIVQIGVPNSGERILHIPIVKAKISIKINQDVDLLGKCLYARQRTVRINHIIFDIDDPYQEEEYTYRVVVQDGRTLYLHKEIEYTIQTTNGEIRLFPPDNMMLTIKQCDENLDPIQPGAEVFMKKDHVYAFNCSPTEVVYDVRAYRNDNTKKALFSVPPEDYTINLNYNFGGHILSVITLSKPLPDVWDADTFYVSLKSGLSPNTGDVIDYLLQNFTDAEIDGESFGIVKTLIDKYPSHFALTQSGDTISICNEIAWQARCGLFLSGTVVKLKYLSLEPESVGTLSDSEIEEASLEMTMTDLDDIITDLVAKYKLKASDEKEVEQHYKNNINLYGLKKEEKEFYIYNNAALILKSLTFWGIRYSNQWIKFELKAFLTELQCEIFDAIDIDSELFSSKCIIESLDHDTTIHGLNYTLWTPVIAGTAITAGSAWLNDDGDVLPPPVVITKRYLPYKSDDVHKLSFATDEGRAQVFLGKVVEDDGGETYLADLFEESYAEQPFDRVFVNKLDTLTLEVGKEVIVQKIHSQYYTKNDGGNVSVRCAAYFAVDPNGLQVVDDIQTVDGDLVLIPSEDIYIVRVGEWERQDTSIGTIVSVKEGTFNGGQTFVLTA